MKSPSLALALAATAALAGSAWAVDEPENVIKYRQALMKSQGAHAAAIVAVLKGEVSFVDHVAAHARGIHETSQLLGPKLFPKGTGQDAFPERTSALPAIWEEPAKFEEAVQTLKEASARMVEVAETGDLQAIGAQLQELGKACGGCHKPFRAKEE